MFIAKTHTPHKNGKDTLGCICLSIIATHKINISLDSPSKELSKNK